jgi:hypothetical protein
MKTIQLILCFLMACQLAARTIDLTPLWDSTAVLRNPDKGWYHHYFDNGIDKYLTKTDADLDDFPGMDHLYLRLAWSFLEPQENQFNWQVIDTVINHWVPKGYKISFRISCRETGLKYATPEWVHDLGVPGKFFNNWGMETWEPDYGHPVFLSKLENFHKSFAARYDGQPWLIYVDIGSYGEWGEGHTSFGSKIAWPNDVMKKHIDIYTSCYKHTPIVISDDFLHQRSEADAVDLRKFIEERKLRWRDDSILVDWYADTIPETFSVASPELFIDSWRDRPVVLECEHYHLMIENGNWQGPDGSVKGAEMLRSALNLTHPTYLGFHGDAPKWYKENPNITRELANILGYWYFLKSVDIPETIVAGTTARVALTWENHGLAPAYHRYQIKIKVEGHGHTFEQNLAEADNRTWMPGGSSITRCGLVLPSSVPEGIYALKIKVMDGNDAVERPVLLAFKDEIRGQDGFYTISTVTISR